MEPLTDDDGMRLLSMEDIEAMTGWTHETVKHYATTGARARREGSAQLKDMPEAVARVRKHMVKSNGKPLVVWASVWREDQIREWLADGRGVEIREPK